MSKIDLEIDIDLIERIQKLIPLLEQFTTYDYEGLCAESAEIFKKVIAGHEQPYQPIKLPAPKTEAERDAELAERGPSYVSIEERFPIWENAREVFKTYTPRMIVFISECSVVGIDAGWQGFIRSHLVRYMRNRSIHEETIAVYLVDMDASFDRVNEFLAKEFPLDRLEGFLQRQITPAMMAEINTMVHVFDDERYHRGSPRFIEAIRHILGIEYCHAMVPNYNPMYGIPGHGGTPI